MQCARLDAANAAYSFVLLNKLQILSVWRSARSYCNGYSACADADSPQVAGCECIRVRNVALFSLHEVFMKLNKLLCGAALAGSLVATDAFADASHEGLEFGLSLNVSIVTGSVEVDGSSADFKETMVGFDGRLSIGYRFQWFGIYLDQDLGGIWVVGDSEEDDYFDEDEGDDKGVFLGGTFVTARGILPLMENALEVNVGLGLGMMYGGGDKSVILNDEGDPSVAFALKVTAGLTYYLTDSIGTGITFDYNVAFNNIKVAGTEIKRTIHSINPGLHIRAQF